jgi:hypothetical protein
MVADTVETYHEAHSQKSISPKRRAIIYFGNLGGHLALSKKPFIPEEGMKGQNRGI